MSHAKARPATLLAMRAWPLWVWVCVVLGGFAVLLARLQFSYDLALFLPSANTVEQQVLLDRVGQGPGSRYLLVSVPGHRIDEISNVRQALSHSDTFARVLDADSQSELDTVPDPLWSHRYLLSEPDLSVDGLASALQDRLADLAFGAPALESLISGDPHLSAIDSIEQLFPINSDASWQMPDGAGLLVIETAGSSFDIHSQRIAVNEVKSVLSSTLGDDAQQSVISGVGAFSVALSQTIEAEARWRSMVATLLVICVLWLAYRRIRPVVVGVLPVVTGALIGLVVVAVMFSKVHGITLAFGFTLLGVAIDYPLHLFSHSRGQPASVAIKRIWPTLRLGLLSTVMAYVAIGLSGAVGLAQLGVFTATGLLVAAAVTRWLLPVLTDELPAPGAIAALPSHGQQRLMRWSPIFVATLIGFAVLGLTFNGTLWNNSLAALSPVPDDVLKRDATMRQALGTASMRYVIAVTADDLQDVLESTEQLHGQVSTLVDRGVIASAQAVTQLLPSAATQQRRRAALPTQQELQQRLSAAVIDSPFSASAFTPFINAVGQQKAASLTLDEVTTGPLSSFVAEHLYQSDGSWVSVLTLRTIEPVNVDVITQWLSDNAPQATLVDFKHASESLVAQYRASILSLLAVALLGVCGLLVWRLSNRRAAWTLATMLSALLCTAAIVYAANGLLNLYHLIALLLVAGLGLDYALFLGREGEDTSDTHASRHAVTACACTTIAAFTVLALSQIPALQSMGQTVAIGSALCFLVAFASQTTVKKTTLKSDPSV